MSISCTFGPYSLSEYPDVREEQRLTAQVVSRICIQPPPHFRFFCTFGKNDARVPDAAGRRQSEATVAERNAKLEAFARAPADLSEILRKCPRHMWARCVAPKLWSIHEIVLHLADTEVQSYIFCRQFIAEPGSSLPPHDPWAWAQSLGYLHQSTKVALELITRLRHMTHQLLCLIPNTAWSHACRNWDNGELTLEHWLDFQQDHVSQHLRQIHQNYEIWAGRQRPAPSGCV